MNEHISGISTYCPFCDTDTFARFESREESLVIRGERVTYSATVAVCPFCGQAVADSRVESANLERAYSSYRSVHGILSPSEIREIRTSYGLSLREFSKFLGFGEQTVARYESGSMPDETHNATILLSKSAQGARQILEIRRGALSEKTIRLAESYIERLEQGSSTHLFWELIQWPPASARKSSPTNGWRGTDIDRVSSVAHALAAQCADLYITKLQKAMFFCDFLAFDRTSRSLTGMEYAHANYGPIMNGKDSVLYALKREGIVDTAQRGWGEIVIPGAEPLSVLSPSEIALIHEVACFINSFQTAGELSDFSHGLPAWSDTRNGELIDYTLHAGEVSAAIERRLSMLGGD